MIWTPEERALSAQRELAEPSDDRKIEMADKKQKRKMYSEQKMEPCLHRTRQSDCWK